MKSADAALPAKQGAALPPMPLEASFPDPFIPFEVLDRLIAAGLGDIPRSQIKPSWFEKAMMGQRVKPVHHHGDFGIERISERPLCPKCGQDELRVRATLKEKRSWLCRGCGHKFVG